MNENTFNDPLVREIEDLLDQILCKKFRPQDEEEVRRKVADILWARNLMISDFGRMGNGVEFKYINKELYSIRVSFDNTDGRVRVIMRGWRG